MKRYVPDRSFPEYAYVPGYWPHPENDPDGHSYGEDEEIESPLDPDIWSDCSDYLFGVDLFNHGFYWEAHECWEQLWHAAGRSGITADFLRALIKLSAIGVKIRQGNDRGISRHAKNAIDEFQQLIERTGMPTFAGLDLQELVSRAKKIRKRPDTFCADPEEEVEQVFDWQLQPGR